MTTHTRPTWPEVKKAEMARHPDMYAAYEAFRRAIKAGQRFSPDRPLILVEHPEDLPQFASEAEEHEYWGVHEMGDAFFEDAAVPDNVATLIERARRNRRQAAAG